MGKVHKRFNWKSRQIVDTIIDDTEQKKILVDFADDKSTYDASNALVLPSAKRKTKKLRDKNAAVKLLSRKQRKKFEKIAEQKFKKAKRTELLKELEKVKASPKEMAVLTSLQETQTLGRKLFLNPGYVTCTHQDLDDGDAGENSKHLNWKAPKAVKSLIKKQLKPERKRKRDPTIVQSESSSSNEEDESSLSEIEELVVANKDSSVVVIENDLSSELENQAEQHNTNAETPCEVISINGVVNSTCNIDTGNLTKDSTGEYFSIKNVKKLPRVARLVARDAEVQKQRLKLPILSEEHTVMEAVNANPFTIIIGKTGSGKTTQVPQFLYEAGYTSNGKMIGITEPRRVAATSMSERVAFEMGLPSSKVSYQIRYEGNTTPETEIKFMTDGVLLKEIMQNHFLSNYSAIIIDEAHERSVHSDILIGLLSRIVPKRNEKGDPLKLIIMSATLRVDDFKQNAKLFKGFLPPVVNIPSRMYDVTIHFNKDTDPDYCSAAYRKVCKIHRQLPDGGILIFLTGQQEINELCTQLKATFPMKTNRQPDSSFSKRMKDRKENRKKKRKGVELPNVELNNFSSWKGDDDEGPLVDDISTEFLIDSEQPLWVLPLYSILPRHRQMMVFQPPPEGTRLCVVATNVAETSLTIPNIKYVVDSGKIKEKLYDSVTGVSSYHVTWTSQASADQRAGRAGRTCDGFCYRLYSSAVFTDELPIFSVPDIKKRPLEDVVLTMKALRVPVLTFPFITPPDEEHLSRSFKRLTVLGALKNDPKLLYKKSGDYSFKDATTITEMGKSMAAFPVSPRFAKMILYTCQHQDIFPYIILLISALTVREVLIDINLDGEKQNESHRRWAARRMQWGGKGSSHLLGDLLVLINAVLEAEKSNASYQWCYENGIRYTALLEIRKLRRQLSNEINALLPDVDITLQHNMDPPTSTQTRIIAEIVFMGSVDQVAARISDQESDSKPDNKKWKHSYKTLNSDKPAFISLGSVVLKDKPKFIMYQEIYESTKVYLRGVTSIYEDWLVHHGGDMVDLSPPLDTPPPKFDTKSGKVVCWRTGAFGPDKWPVSQCEVPYPVCKDLFKWVAYFFLIGELWPQLQNFSKHLYDPKTLIRPISLRYRDKRENLIRALMSRNITSSKLLENVWKEEPNFLKPEYFSWFEEEDELVGILRSKWPPLKESEYWYT